MPYADRFDSPNSLTAEQAYLFRHALLREAAYELQPPGERARLHALAFEAAERAHGGEAPDPGEPVPGSTAIKPHPTDPIAFELAVHLRHADDDALRKRQRIYLHRAAQHAERTHQNPLAVAAWSELAELLDGVSRAEALRRAGVTAHNSGNAMLAADFFSRAQKGFTAARHNKGEGVALIGLSYSLFELSRHGEAEQALQRAIELNRAADDRKSEGIALGALAGILLQTGRREQGVRVFEEALAIHRATGNRRDEGIVLGNLGVAYFQTGQQARCLDAFEQSLAAHRATGQRLSEGITLANLAYICHMEPRPELAGRLLHEALAIMRETGAKRWEGIVYGYLGTLHARSGRHADAEREFNRALVVHREVRNRRFEGANLCDLGLTQLALGRSSAADTWRQGAAILLAIGDRAELEEKSAAMRAACAKAGVRPFDG